MLPTEKMPTRALASRARRKTLLLVAAAALVFYLVHSYPPPFVFNVPKLGISSPPKDDRLSWEEFRERIDLRGPGEASTYARTPMDCGVDAERLARIRKRHSIAGEFHYLRRYVRFTTGGERESVSEIPQPFLPHPLSQLNSSVESHSRECPPPIDVTVPESGHPSTVNASDFLFGVATTLDRFLRPSTNPIAEWKFWLTDGKGRSNGAKLIVLLSSGTHTHLQELEMILRGAGIDADVFPAEGSEMAVRYLHLIPAMYNHPLRPAKKWLVTVDDDTFFPSMYALIASLEKHDHTRPIYIGTLSEDLNNLPRHGSQAFGGAGVFLSPPAARIVADNFEGCTSSHWIRRADTGWGPQGDVLLRNCLYENSDLRLTTLDGLWQLDMRGDPAGFFESGVAPLSLHHYRGGMWFVARALQYAKAAYACGEGCVLQRFRTADDFVLSGFSVAHYPRGMRFDMGKVERTFGAMPPDFGGNFDYAMGPQRPGLHGTGRKVSWELQEAELGSDGSLVQVYIRHGRDKRFLYKDGDGLGNRDGVIEVVWIPG